MSIFDGMRENWEAPEPYRLAWLVPLALAAVVIAVALAACQARPAPATSGATSTEAGFSAFCAAHPHAGTCP